MFGVAPNSYGGAMETMKSLTPQLTLVASATESAGFAEKCAGFTLRAVKACWKAYVQAAQYNAYWIGWPGAPQRWVSACT